MKRKILAAIVASLAIAIVIPAAHADIIGLEVTFRDFQSSHIDFENYLGDDRGIVEDILGSDGKPVYAGEAGNPSTHGETAFNQWYNDTAGVNLSLDTTLNFTQDLNGNYVFTSSSFFPLDGLLFGNEGNSHNYHFTMELHTEFTYQAGQFFEFTGDDDVWVFIDNKLVIDLGGVHVAENASVDLDTLSLTPGETYNFDLFFAERHTTESNFKATTNIVQDTVVPLPGAFILGILGIGAAGIKLRKHA